MRGYYGGGTGNCCDKSRRDPDSTVIKNTVEQYLGESVRDAVITVPAYFDDSQTRTKIKKAIGRQKKAMEGENINEIDRLTGELQKASYKMSEQLYHQASGSDGQASQNSGDDVIDTDYNDVA